MLAHTDFLLYFFKSSTNCIPICNKGNMTRTLINLDPKDKAWLERKAKEEHVPLARLVQRAVQRLRQESEPPSQSLPDLLQRTRGLWKRGDGLVYQREQREEWGRR